MVKQTTQPTPIAAAVAALTPEPQSEGSNLRSSTSLFGMSRTAQGRETFPNKQAFMGDIRQRLAQVADTAKVAGETSKEVEGLADASATRLYQARVLGMIN